jgi:copper(I)-binding protein
VRWRKEPPDTLCGVCLPNVGHRRRAGVILNNRCAWPLRGLAIVAAAVLAPAIAGCEAGTNAPTQRWHQPTAGASAVVDNVIRINNVFVLGPPPDSSLAAGDSAGMFLALANNGTPDRLIAISAPGTAAAVQFPVGGVGLGSRQSVLLTGPAPQVILRGLTRSLIGGQFVRVVLDFQRAGIVKLTVPVMPRSDYFATFSPAPASPAAAPSPSGSPVRKKGKHAAATPSPTSPAPSVSPTA